MTLLIALEVNPLAEFMVAPEPVMVMVPVPN
jgi:hypothetical protein